MQDRRLFRVTPALVVAFLVGACSQPVHAIDGFPVGRAANCERDFTPSCEQIIEAALRAFDGREPGHAAIDRTTVHDEDRSVFPEGMTRSGSLMVVVFDLVDGTRRAGGAYCGPGPDGARCSPVPEYEDPSGG